jgi:hypothetical protein
MHALVNDAVRLGLERLESPIHAEAIATLLWIDLDPTNTHRGTQKPPRVTDRRNTAAELLGVAAQTLERHKEKELLKTLAEQLIVLCEAHRARSDSTSPLADLSPDAFVTTGYPHHGWFLTNERDVSFSDFRARTLQAKEYFIATSPDSPIFTDDMEAMRDLLRYERELRLLLSPPHEGQRRARLKDLIGCGAQLRFTDSLPPGTFFLAEERHNSWEQHARVHVLFSPPSPPALRNNWIAYVANDDIIEQSSGVIVTDRLFNGALSAQYYERAKETHLGRERPTDLWTLARKNVSPEDLDALLAEL